MLAEFGKPGTTFSMKLRSVVSEFSYLVWKAATADR
jgi:hypothetical protein